MLGWGPRQYTTKLEGYSPMIIVLPLSPPYHLEDSQAQRPPHARTEAEATHTHIHQFGAGSVRGGREA
eukprot:9048256-Pyramimonas_sp.AAC.1